MNIDLMGRHTALQFDDVKGPAPVQEFDLGWKADLLDVERVGYLPPLDTEGIQEQVAFAAGRIRQTPANFRRRLFL